jgi:chorismate dehydratase
MSSFFYLKSNRPDAAMTLIKGLSISSIGAVGSVLIFSKRELRQLKHCKIAVPQSSATSINLLHVLLQEEFGITATFVTAQKPDLSNQQVDAALVIGDRALSVDEEWSQRYLRVDMGDWWYRNYRLPMTFGVWAARNEWVAANKNSFAELSGVLTRSAQIGLTSGLDDVIEESMRRIAFSRERLERYFLRELDFDFSEAHERGLLLYRDLCVKHGLLTAAAG